MLFYLEKKVIFVNDLAISYMRKAIDAQLLVLMQVHTLKIKADFDKELRKWTATISLPFDCLFFCMMINPLHS
jgi:hypothetical protein